MGSLFLPPTNIHRRSCTSCRSLRAQVSVVLEGGVRHLCRLFPSGQKKKEFLFLSPSTCQDLLSRMSCVFYVGIDYQYDARFLVKDCHISLNLPSHALVRSVYYKEI